METASLRQQLLDLYASVLRASRQTNHVPEAARMSAANLLAYVELRKHDLSELQLQLADLGLSSLGRMEGQVLHSLEHVLTWLDGWCGDFSQPDRSHAEQLLAARSRALFGRPRPARDTRIMVTLDHETENREGYLEALLLAGMDIARINCGHGTADDWRGLVRALRGVEERLEREGRPQPRRCRVQFDLAGPKLRVGEMADVRHLRAGESLTIARAVVATDPDAIPCTLPEALAAVEVGHRVALDDGKFQGRVSGVDETSVTIAITAPGDRPRKLKPGKGINLPDTPINLPALSVQDRADLRSIADIADAVGLSFVHRPEDLTDLSMALEGLGRGQMGIVAKIETQKATRNLASILLTGLSLPAFGVMIARGDLAVEVGFEDLAVMQDSILCLCEAAHVPAIWATQVLETLAQSGLPARAEITDAAASRRADCVMLNKGPHVAAAAAMLDRLLTAEQRHRTKKRQLFREFIAQEGPLAPTVG